MRQEAEITDYLAGQVQNTRQILLPADVPEDVSFNAVAEYDDIVMLCGDEGYVLEISPEGDTRLHNVGDNTRLISIAGGPSGWVALSSNGNYHFSLEGRDWAGEYIPGRV